MASAWVGSMRTARKGRDLSADSFRAIYFSALIVVVVCRRLYYLCEERGFKIRVILAIVPVPAVLGKTLITTDTHATAAANR